MVLAGTDAVPCLLVRTGRPVADEELWPAADARPAAVQGAPAGFLGHYTAAQARSRFNVDEHPQQPIPEEGILHHFEVGRAESYCLGGEARNTQEVPFLQAGIIEPWRAFL